MISFAQQEVVMDSMDVYMPEVKNVARHFIDDNGYFDIHEFRELYKGSYVGTITDMENAFIELDSMALVRNTQTFYVIKVFNNMKLIGCTIGQEEAEEKTPKKEGRF